MKYENKFIYYTIFIFISVYLYIVLCNFGSLTYRIYDLSLYGQNFIPKPYYELILGIISFIMLTVITEIFFKKYQKFWLIKAFVTIFILILHEYLKGLDAYLYYANILYRLDDFEFGTRSSANLIHINHIFTYLVGESYFSLKLVNSYIGFLGLILFYKSYQYINGTLIQKDNFILLLFLFPSLLFWSSILGKDPINFFCVALFIYASLHFIDKINPRYVIFIILSFAIVYLYRPWYPVIMILALFMYYVKLTSFKDIIIFLILAIPTLYMFKALLAFNGITSFDVIFETMTKTTRGFSYGKAATEVHTITNLMDYLKYFIPNTFTALFRPMPYEARSPIMLISSIENLVIFYLFIRYIVFNIKYIFTNKYLKFLLLFVISWLLFYTIISPGNLGAAARFKLQVLPIILILIFSVRNYSDKTLEGIK